jgi:hypothetical protein
MSAMSLRRAAAGLSLAVCLSLIHTPAAQAKPAPAGRGPSQVHAQPAAGHGLITMLWNYLVTVVTGAPAPGGTPPKGDGHSDAGGTADPNGYPLADAGGTADPNGLPRVL